MWGQVRFLLAVLLALLLLGGCYQKRFQWSPDGKRVALITNDGLYLSDAEGKLSELLLPAVKTAAWFSDSQRLAVSTEGGRLAVGHLEGEAVVVDTLLYWGRTATDVRVAPGDMHLAFTIDNPSDRSDDFSLFVVPTRLESVGRRYLSQAIARG